MRITPMVTRVRTVKSLKEPNGTFELSLTFEPPLDPEEEAAAEQESEDASAEETEKLGSLNQILVPDNLVAIQFDRGLPGDELQTVMLGWITDVGQRTTVTSGAQPRPQREIVVRGQDAGKFLARHQLPGWLLSAFMLGDKEVARRIIKAVMVAGAPGTVLQTFFEKVYLNLVPTPQASVGATGFLADRRLYASPLTSGPVEPGTMFSWADVSSAWLGQGKFWSLLKQHADQPWNELWGDYVNPENFPTFKKAGNLRGPGYHVVFRRQPFDQRDWDALPTHTIPDAQLKFEQVRRADAERINVVLLQPTGSAMRGGGDERQDAVRWATMQVSRESANRHGTQILAATTIYSNLAQAHRDPEEHEKVLGQKGNLYQALLARTRTLWKWYSINARLYNGIWVVMGDPAIKIGQRVQNQEEPSAFFNDKEYTRRVYYVERVVQDYQDGRHYLTHLALTRGQPLGVGGFIEAATPDANPFQTEAAA
jgi:hypothetical protein